MRRDMTGFIRCADSTHVIVACKQSGLWCALTFCTEGYIICLPGKSEGESISPNPANQSFIRKAVLLFRVEAAFLMLKNLFYYVKNQLSSR